MHTGNVVVAWVTSLQDRLAAEVRRIGLEHRDLAALTLVAAYDGCSQDWLRGRIDLTQSGTVRLVDRLAARDLLRRGPSSGRGVPLHVTPAGTDVLGEWARSRDRIVTEVLDALPLEARDGLVRAMTHALQAQPRIRPHADTTCRTCTWPACGADCPVDRSVAGALP